jgi:hypothetical protein
MAFNTILLLKILVTPALVLTASLAGRAWGQSIGGWLIALPLTSGPVAFFLAIDQGPAFVQDTAFGVVSGAAAQGGFSVGYARAAERHGWPLALAAGMGGYVLIVAVLRALGLPFAGLVAVALLVLIVSVRLMPKQRYVAHRDFVHPVWDLPGRMLVATALVVGLTAAAPLTGPWLSGVLATVPVFGGVMTVFAHRHYGTDAAVHVVWGFALGIFSVVGFFFALANLIVPLGIAVSFCAAIAAAFATQGLTLWAMPRPKAT